MALQQTLTASFLGELARGVHALETDTIKMALYTGNANLGVYTLAYTDNGEASGAGYVAGGNVLANVTVTATNTGTYISFDNPAWTNAAFVCRGALLYNASKNDAAIAVLNFGSDKTAGPNFTVVLPANTATTALLRISF